MENGIYDDSLNNPLNNRRRRSTPVSPLMRGVLLILRTLLLLCSFYILWLFVFWFVRRGRHSSALAVLILSAVSAGWSFISLWATCFGHQKLAIFMVVVDLLGMAVMIAVTILSGLRLELRSAQCMTPPIGQYDIFRVGLLTNSVKH